MAQPLNARLKKQQENNINNSLRINYMDSSLASVL